MNFWADKDVLVTGSTGFLGSHLLEKLRKQSPRSIFSPSSSEYDLVRQDDIARLLADARPNIVVHLAARVGGIGANRANPGKFFYDNLMMGVQLMEQSRQIGVEKFVALGTICAYPKFTPVPFN